MAPKAINVSAVLIVLTILSADAAMAQSDCTNVLISMASCLNYVTGSSNTPSSSCCSALANVVQTQPRCLCTIVNGGGGGSFGVTINQTQALALPGACKVETPPISRCNAVNGPAMSPVASPESSPPESVDGTNDSPTSPSVKGSRTDAAASNGSISKIHPQLVAFFLFVIALHSSTFIGY